MQKESKISIKKTRINTARCMYELLLVTKQDSKKANKIETFSNFKYQKYK